MKAKETKRLTQAEGSTSSQGSKRKDGKEIIPPSRQIGEIAFLNEEGKTIYRSTKGLTTKAVIRETIFKIIEETGIIPSIKDVKEVTGYSLNVVRKHLEELNPDFNDKYRLALYPLTGKVLKSIFQKAVAGDMKAAELWLAFVHKFKVNDPGEAEGEEAQTQILKIGGVTIEI